MTPEDPRFAATQPTAPEARIPGASPDTAELELAYMLGRIAYLAYPANGIKAGDTFVTRSPTGASHTFDVISLIHENRMDTDAMIVREPKTGTVVVAFAGTESARDVLTNLDALKDKWTIGNLYVGEVHSGFLEAFQRTAMPWLVKHKDLLYGAKKLYVTGHSLGSGLAQLCGLWINISASHPSKSRTISFAGPRVGDEYARMTSLNFCIGLTNYMNNYDPVCVVPLERMGYRRFGSNSSGVVVLQDDGRAVYVSSRYWWGIWPTSFGQHRMGKYLENLRKALGGEAHSARAARFAPARWVTYSEARKAAWTE